jgi:23S rRNA pseudouridine1911/1915/1917 synthase
MAIIPDGREAVTEIKVAAFNDKISLVLAKPRTGRTHQIRVHLKAIGAPVLGDEIYGKRDAFERHLLHAYQLKFTHPITGTPLQIIAPIPEDMKFWMQKLCGPSLCSAALREC